MRGAHSGARAGLGGQPGTGRVRGRCIHGWARGKGEACCAGEARGAWGSMGRLRATFRRVARRCHRLVRRQQCRVALSCVRHKLPAQKSPETKVRLKWDSVAASRKGVERHGKTAGRPLAGSHLIHSRIHLRHERWVPDVRHSHERALAARHHDGRSTPSARRNCLQTSAGARSIPRTGERPLYPGREVLLPAQPCWVDRNLRC